MEQLSEETQSLKTCIMKRGIIINDLSDRMHKIRFNLMKKYNQNASTYHSETYERMGKELLDTLNVNLKVFFYGQLSCLHTDAIKVFSISLQVCSLLLFHIKSPSLLSVAN